MIFAALLSITVTTPSNADDIIVDQLPDNSVGPVGNVDGSYKFDDGFYQKIQQMIDTKPQDGAPNVHDGKIYHTVVFVVARDDGDLRSSDEVASENKEALAKRLADSGALNIRQGEVLSFVTASVPVTELPGLSLHDEIFGIGDGELEIVTAVDAARKTIRATSDEITTSSGTVLTGSGVVVAVIDSGINHPRALNPNVIKHVSCGTMGCSNVADVSTILPTGSPSPLGSDTTHGTQVAQVLAASMIPYHDGIAPGVKLLDAIRPAGAGAASMAHGLDWSLKNGADIVNLSIFIRDPNADPKSNDRYCGYTNPSTYGLLLNEVVDKGLITVHAAGNEGRDISSDPKVAKYNSIDTPGCSHNTITVGGIDSTDTVFEMYKKSARGPVTDTQPRLKPDLVAPAVEIQTLSFTHNSTTDERDGTSYAAPQVSATAALLLQAKPDLTPVETKSAILLGADWKAPIPCTSVQFEINNTNDNCSYARQPTDPDEANNAASLGILNNVGFGILNVNQTLEYTSERTPSHNHVMGDYLDTRTTSKKYTFSVTDTSEPVKIILTWFAHPHGSITEQVTQSKTVPVADLGFTIKPPKGSTINANSKHQTNEFAVFMPSVTGTYTITVTGSGLDKINKPVQNYAIASTHSLTLLPSPFTNTSPVAHPKTIIINPADADPAVVRLVGSDQDGDPVSFSVSRDPAHGIVSTDEQITKTVSRMFYNSTGSVSRDSFQVTPQDGLVAGRPATITILAESLPPRSQDVPADSSQVKKWDTLEVVRGFAHKEYTSTFSGPGYPVTHLYLGSVNMEGTDAKIVTSKGTYTAAVPPSGDRMIQFVSPTPIKSITLSADGIDEEAAHDRKKASPAIRKSAIYTAFLYNDVRIFAGFVPSACSGVSGTQGVNACPAHTTYDVSSSPDLAIADNKRTQSASDTILVPVNGTLRSASLSVDITHTYTGDLKVDLSSPAGDTIKLHDRTGGSTDNIKKTYTSPLSKLAGGYIAGNWTLGIGDYANGDTGTLNSWSLSLQYKPVTTIQSNNSSTNATVTIFSDDFEGNLSKWTETGEGDWTISTSQSHLAPTLPGKSANNKVLHSDNCDTTCTITTKNSIDLSGYASANLSLWRFVDSSHDRNEYLRVQLSDGSSWKTIFDWSANNKNNDNKWHKVSYDMSAYAGKSSVGLRFVTHQNSANEDAQIDDVMISASTTKPAPTKPAPVTPTGYSIYIADTDDSEILVYSSAGKYVDDIVPRKSGGLGKAYDVAFGPDGHMYVSDNTNSKIRKYNGATGATMGTTSTTSKWASVNGIPNGITWNGNTLYVATLKGVDRISSTGSNLGFFGDASRTPSTSGAPKLVSPYDVAFCPDGNMYVADRSLNRILYYDGSTGKYKGTISPTPSSIAPDMKRASGLVCAPAIMGTGTSLYQSGDDAGRINEINYSTKRLVHKFTSLIDEPYGMDSDSSGNIYVANKDDDNALRITSGGTISVFATGSLDDPRGLTVGPKYVAQASTSSESSTPVPDNDGPEVLLKNGTATIKSHMHMVTNSTVTLNVVATDPEDDTITLDIVPYSIPETAVSLKQANGTATVTVSTNAIPSGVYAFMITASDEHNLERFGYTVIIP